jgi:hypothetical protein
MTFGYGRARLRQLTYGTFRETYARSGATISEAALPPCDGG